MDQLTHRKAEGRLRILLPDGAPAANREIRVDQQRSDFLFGCGVFDAFDMMREDTPRERRAVLQKRMDHWLKLFNFGTLPFYWGRYEPEEGRLMAEPMMKAARWLHEEKGVALKGHPLCWHTVCAPWLMRYDNAEILRRQVARIHRDVTPFKGLIDMWDVINEVVIMPNFDKYDNAITRICREKGRIRLVKEVFEASREANPGAVLLLNDFNVTVAYEMLIEALLDAGVKIDAIGIQSHQHQGYWGLEKLQGVLERFGRFGLPLHFTENTILSGHPVPPEIDDLNDYQIPVWPSTPEGEGRQARELREMYGALFAHPQVAAITTWSPADGGWLGAPAGILREDGTPKPAYHALLAMRRESWETHETLRTDEQGRVRLSAFKGVHLVQSEGLGAQLELHAGGEQVLRLV